MSEGKLTLRFCKASEGGATLFIGHGEEEMAEFCHSPGAVRWTVLTILAEYGFIESEES